MSQENNNQSVNKPTKPKIITDARVRNLVTALLLFVLGILCIVYREKVAGVIMQVAFTVVGVVFIISAVLDFMTGAILPAIIKAVVGVAVIVMGWALMDIVLYVIGAMLIIYGIIDVIMGIRAHAKGMEIYAIPVMWIIIGILICCQGIKGVANVMFIILGIMLIIEGVALALKGLKH